MTTGQIILWVYIALLLAGGLAGFLKAGSKASLIASGIFAAVLALFALNLLPFAYSWIVQKGVKLEQHIGAFCGSR